MLPLHNPEIAIIHLWHISSTFLRMCYIITFYIHRYCCPDFFHLALYCKHVPFSCVIRNLSNIIFTAEVEGNEGFPPPLEKDLDSPSSKCLEALVPSLD